eukprot:CAMPEP_0181499650 /NCGR_PEP_ID=MMETSP1110-20121109/54776_1 /TAXON_ID=174948 /ORGANISM="Symbiodinium sp., Strain CCMP421" /LENGTH=421 /DNA_ID=CAMNT_0023627859 /DNA_START=49 /DNA_END=1311 /DNA_ORIENTATION=-
MTACGLVAPVPANLKLRIVAALHNFGLGSSVKLVVVLLTVILAHRMAATGCERHIPDLVAHRGLAAGVVVVAGQQSALAGVLLGDQAGAAAVALAALHAAVLIPGLAQGLHPGLGQPSRAAGVAPARGLAAGLWVRADQVECLLTILLQPRIRRVAGESRAGSGAAFLRAGPELPHGRSIRHPSLRAAVAAAKGIAALIRGTALLAASLHLHRRVHRAEVVEEGALLSAAFGISVATTLLPVGIWLPAFPTRVHTAEWLAAAGCVVGDQSCVPLVGRPAFWALKEAAGGRATLLRLCAGQVLFGRQRRPSSVTLEVFTASLVAAKLVVLRHVLRINLVWQIPGAAMNRAQVLSQHASLLAPGRVAPPILATQPEPHANSLQRSSFIFNAAASGRIARRSMASLNRNPSGANPLKQKEVKSA